MLHQYEDTSYTTFRVRPDAFESIRCIVSRAVGRSREKMRIPADDLGGGDWGAHVLTVAGSWFVQFRLIPSHRGHRDHRKRGKGELQIAKYKMKNVTVDCES